MTTSEQLVDSKTTAPDDIAKRALEALDEMEITPIPVNYAVWYSHLERKNKNLSTEIESALSNKDSVDESFLLAVHKKYLSQKAPINKIEQFAAGILEETKNLKTIVTSADASAKGLNNDLEQILLPNAIESESSNELNEVISSLFHATQKAIARNNELEDDLSKAAAKIETLQCSIEEIADDAETDHLTELKNRRYFDKSLPVIADHAKQEGTPLCLIVADIDHFKNFNDKWGHKVGDQVLKLVAHTLQDNVKGQDLVARYGGEEFVIALPETSLQNAKKLAETIRVSVSKRKLINKSNGDVLGNITMSFGVAAYNEKENLEELFEKADKALYVAKESGRNRVMEAAAA